MLCGIAESRPLPKPLLDPVTVDEVDDPNALSVFIVPVLLVTTLRGIAVPELDPKVDETAFVPEFDPEAKPVPIL